MTGTITYVKKAEPNAQVRKGSGYGFIRDEEGRDRMFIHSEVVGTKFEQLTPHLRVEFEPTVDPSRPADRQLRAVKVRVLA